MKEIALWLLVVAFSVGWLLPAWLSLSTYLTFISFKMEVEGYSFPFIDFARGQMTLSLIWLAAVIAFWAWKATSA